MSDTDIFIFTESIPNVYPKSDEYKLVTLKPLDSPCDIENIIVGNYSDPILEMEHAYSECARIHALWKNYPIKKYIGLNHYRRYFDFFDKVPNLDEIFSKHDVIYPKFNLGWPLIEANYAGCHNIEDLKKCVEIIEKYWPGYSDSAKYVMENGFIVPCNNFITTKEMFNSWCDFVFGVLDEYNKQMGFKTDLDVYNHVVNNMDKYVEGKGGLPNSSTAYQSRIHAFLSERLSTIFFHYNALSPYNIDIVLTETHFDFEKTYFKQYEKQDISDNN